MKILHPPHEVSIIIEKPGSEWVSGWRAVACGMLGMWFATTYIPSIGILMGPIQDELGWKREQITFGLTIVSLVSVVLNPFIGLLVDRYGAHRVAIPGIIVNGLALALLATTGTSVTSWWLRWLFVGVGFSLVTSTVWITGAASHFTRQRGLAIALCLVGTGLSAATVPIISEMAARAYGWRAAYLILGLGGMAIMLPLAAAWFRDGRRLALAASDDAPVALEPGLTIRQILGSRRYWQLAAVSVAAVTGLVGLMVHFVPILVDVGITRTTAAGLAGLIGVGNIVGRFAGGYLLDRIHGAIVGSVALALPVLVCLSLNLVGGEPALAGVLAFLVGLSLGAETDVIAYLATRYFGLRNFGFAFGSLAGFMSLGGGIGPWLGGALYDRLGSYLMFEFALCGAFALAVILIATLGRYPPIEALAGGTGQHGRGR